MLKEVVVIENNYKNIPPFQKGGCTIVKNVLFFAG